MDDLLVLYPTPFFPKGPLRLSASLAKSLEQIKNKRRGQNPH
jgi:hypothetical protein